MPKQDTLNKQSPWQTDDGSFMAINIGPREQRKRKMYGIIIFVLTGALLLVMIILGISRWWRLPLIIPYWIAGTGYFQAKEKTCVMHAVMGTCNLDSGNEQIEDSHLIEILRSQAKKVSLFALTSAVILTSISLALPYYRLSTNTNNNITQ
jgi:hypothetical protein